MDRNPGMFRSWPDALLCGAFSVVITAWLVVGMLIVGSALVNLD